MYEDKSKLVEVFSGTTWEADLVKSLLGDNGIKSVPMGETALNMLYYPINLAEVRLCVNECDTEAARLIVEEYKKREADGNK